MKYSKWIDAGVNCPQRRGWYQVGDDPSRIEARHYAYWDGEAWQQPRGWPASDPYRWKIIDGRLIVPCYGKEPMTPRIGSWEPAIIERWRGFL